MKSLFTSPVWKIFTPIIFFCLTTMSQATEDIVVTGLIGNKVIIIINGKNYVIPEGESSPNGVKVVSIKHDERKVVLSVNGEENIYPLDISGNRGRSSIKLVPDNSGIYRVTGKINQTPINFVVDTGATLVTLNRKDATKLGIDLAKAQKGTSETASGKVPVHIVMLDEVEINGLRLKNIPAAVHEGNYPSVALLGMSFIKHLDMRREGQILYLGKR